MKMTIWIFILNSIIYIKISEAQYPQGGFIPPSTPAANSRQIPPTGPRPDLPAATPQYFDLNTPKCYPETAKAYFLPAPPSQPIITVLDRNYKDASENKKAYTEMKKDAASNSQRASNIEVNHANFIPPPPIREPMLPDLIDKVPNIVQERVSRLAESDVKVCNACANLIEKLPIFKFDQELLHGFLAGLGL